MYPSIIAGTPLSVSDAAQAPPDYLATDRAYCILVRPFLFSSPLCTTQLRSFFQTRYPLFGSHFDILLSLLAHERAVRLSKTMSSSQLASPSPVLEEIRKAAEVRIERATPPVNVILKMDLFAREIDEEIPFLDCAGNLDSYFADMVVKQSLPTLLQRVCLANILKIFNAVILCKQIIFRAKSPGLASAACLATSLMIRPTRWEGVLVPTLPESMATALQAPVPFIIGITSNPDRAPIRIGSLDGIVVDLDRDKVTSLSSYAALPALTQLANNLAPILQKHFVVVGASSTAPRPPFDPSQDQKMAALQAFACFRAYNTWLIGKVMIFIDSTDEDLTLKQLKPAFLKTVTAVNRSFVETWIHSQNMTVYLECELQKRRQVQK